MNRGSEYQAQRLNRVNKKLYKVASPNDIKTGKATILTVTEGNEVKEYEINILKLNNCIFDLTSIK